MNKVEALRILQESRSKLSTDQKLILQQGFTSGFWKLLNTQLQDTLTSLQGELETCKEMNRVFTLQGEIAALRVLLDFAEATLREPKQNPYANLLVKQ